MTYIGIDYSRISPAFTIYDEGEFYFCSIQREGNIRDRYKETLETSGVEVDVIDKIAPHDDESEMEAIYSYDADYQAQMTANKLKGLTEGKDISIALEGLSFASSGASSLTYAGYHFILRKTLSDTLGVPYERIEIVAPSRVKKTAGKGNYNKDQMIEAFIGDEFFSSSKLWQDINKIPEVFQSPKAKKWQKPLDDLVDSAYLCKYIYLKSTSPETFLEK